MKLKGSTGGISRTMIFNTVLLGIDTIIVNFQLLEQIMSPTTFAIVFISLSVVHKIGSMILRAKTTGPLQ